MEHAGKERKMIFDLYEKASVLHGHKCPGLALGVRVADEAMKKLGVEQGDERLRCVTEKMACFNDGIQSVSGCTMKNGRLSYLPNNKVAFRFYLDGSEESIYYTARELGHGGDREEKIKFILTAPIDEVFIVE